MSEPKEKKWSYKECWTQRGKTFAVEIVHWTREFYKTDEKRHIWNVYVYLYDTHPLHKKFRKTNEKNYWRESTHGLEFHGGCTYFERLANKTIKLGCDYIHHIDDGSERRATLKDAWEVEMDASELFDHLKGLENACEQTQEPTGRDRQDPVLGVASPVPVATGSM